MADVQAHPKIEMRPIGSLRRYANNARQHSRAQVKQIARSIERFGFINPVLVSDEGEIIAGHGRIMAAQQLGLAEVPVIALSHLSATERGQIVLDAFGGSGSTLIAAQICGRTARLIEYDPLYCDTIITRWQRLTCQQAMLMRRAAHDLNAPPVGPDRQDSALLAGQTFEDVAMTRLGGDRARSFGIPQIEPALRKMVAAKRKSGHGPRSGSGGPGV